MKWTTLLMLVAGLFGSVFFWLSYPPRWPSAEPPPNVSKDFKKECSITRDKWDVPHIKASSNEALMFCLGSIHAQDRGWQMDFLRRVAYGRSAEVYGSHMLRTDFFLRILSFHRVAQRWVKALPKQQPKEYRLLRFYVWGVNHGFKALRSGPKRPYLWKKRGSYQPPAWRLEDTMMILLLQSFNQTRRSFTRDIQHARLRLQLGEKRYRELYGADDKLKVFDHLIIKPGEHPLAPFVGKGKTKVAPPSGTKPVPRRTMLFDEKSQMMRAFAEIQTLVGKAWDTRGLGSNNWVLAPSRSKSGHALLANDPHLAILTPSFWHEVHLTAPGLDVMGVAVPGTTAVVSGHNRHLAWGITNGYSNAADIVAVQPKKGVFQLGSKTIKVEKFSPTVWVRIGFLHVPIFWKSFYRTSHGPFLPIQWIQKKKLLLKFSGYHLKESPLYAISRLMRAKSAREADESLKLMKLPNWNLVFADTRGNIGYRQVGLVPRRKSGTYGLLDPTKPKQLWDGFLKDHETAALLNPKRGFIATANNRTFPIHFPFFLGHAFVEGYRAKRIEALIRKTPKHTIASMQKIQLDVKVPGAEILLDTMLAILAKQTLTAESKQAVKLLSRWDKLATREQVAPTLFRLWFLFLEEALFENDSKGRSGLPFQTKVKPGYPAVKRVLKGTLKVKTKNPIGVVVRLSLEKTIEKLKKDLGGSMTDWKWRNYHRMYFFHQLGPHLTTRPKDRGVVGDEHTVNLSQNRGGGPFRVKVGPSYRLVVELSPKRIRSFGVLAGKQVDVQPRVLGEQQQMWIEGKYRPRPFYPDDLAKYKKSEKTLTW